MKGTTNNPNGRPKGVKNKVTTDMRAWITSFIEDQRKQLETDWKALEPKDRVQAFQQLLKYSLPTLQATSLTTNFDNMSDEDLDRIIEGIKQSANENNNDKGGED